MSANMEAVKEKPTKRNMITAKEANKIVNEKRLKSDVEIEHEIAITVTDAIACGAYSATFPIMDESKFNRYQRMATHFGYRCTFCERVCDYQLTIHWDSV